MLTRLNVEGMAIIESLSIEFSPGFNIITGETGAGKSILIKALNFLTGARASVDWIRKGCPTASVTAEFAVAANHPSMSYLEELGIPVDENQGMYVLLVRRQLNEKNRSQAWVNDVSVTNQTLRQLGSSLLDIFSQHENQRLMLENEHVRYLDQFVGDPELLRHMESLNRDCLEKIKKIRQMVSDFEENHKNRDYFEFRMGELKKFSPSEEDYVSVKELCDRAGQMLKIQQLLSQALDCLEGNESNISQGIHKLCQYLVELEDLLEGGDRGGKLSEFKKRSQFVAEELDDLNYELRKLVSDTEVSEDDLEAAQSRLFGYQELFRKHSVKDVSSLVEEAERLNKIFEELENATSELKIHLRDLGERSTELNELATKLTQARHKAAAKAKKRVEKELYELEMKGAAFNVEFNSVQRALSGFEWNAFDRETKSLWESAAEKLSSVTEWGAEKGRFLLASNPGEPMLPLTKIASGGEMARILLALKKALVADADTCVLVFDEIDTGVSGRVADVVGEKLRDLTKNFQVLCISHLPQVAVYADTHFKVFKEKRGKRTEATMVRLSKEDSVSEIARLLSGAKVSASSLANARNLIKKARNRRVSGKVERLI